VALTQDARDVIIDQNVARVDFAAALADYTFQQAGNTLRVYQDAALVTRVAVQGDQDGTLVSFGDGTYSLRLVGNILRLADAAVPSVAGAVVNPGASLTVSAAPAPGASAPGTHFYLQSSGHVAVGNSDIKVYGASAMESISLLSGVSGVVVDQNIERLTLDQAASSYVFEQAGNQLNVLEGGVMLVSFVVQGDSDGTLLDFGDGTSQSVQLVGQVMTLDGVALV
jgi:hypothetical protein